MAFSFPSSPALNTVSVQNGRSYTYVGGGVWQLTPATGGSGLTWSSVPASATATGTAGQIAYDDASGFFYVATAQNTWKRAALSTWVNFTPASISGLRVWLDSSVSSSIYDATSGGSVVTNGNAVARWNDLSGNNNHFVQSNSTYRPILTSTGLACAENTNRFMSADLAQTTNAMSVFIVATLTARNSGLNRYGRFFSASNGSNHDYASNDGILLGDDVSIVQVYRNSGSVVSTTAATINQRVVVGFTLNGGAVTLYRNASTSSGTTSTTSLNSTAMRIGESATPAVDSGLAGVFHEVAIYSAAIGSTDAAQLVSYLMTKWAIS